MARTHTSKWKTAHFEGLKKIVAEYPVLALADLNMCPAPIIQRLRKAFGEGTVIRAVKTRILRKALKESNKDYSELEKITEKSVALIASKMNPFELYAILKKNKINISAKAGMIAEKDIIIPAGGTSLPPGPALSTLKEVGLKVKPEGATISIMADKVVVKEGEAVSPEISSVLTLLDIKPIQVMLKLIGAQEEGKIFNAEVLDIDSEQIERKFITAYQNSLNLSVEIGYPTKANIELLISKAFRASKELSLETNFLTKFTSDEILAKSSTQTKSSVHEGVEEIAKEVQEEKKEDV